MQGMETAYVGNGVSAGSASTTVGRTVIKSVAEKYSSNNQIGKATITVEDFGALNDISSDATVTIYTTDFEVIGTIELDGGKLTWGEIESNTPGIKIINAPSSLSVNGTAILETKLKKIPLDTPISWSSSETDIATVNQETGEVKGVTEGTITITAEAIVDGVTYTGTCDIEITQSKADKINSAIGTVVKYPKATATTAGYSADYDGSWRVFYADDEELFIIPTTIIDFGAIPSTGTAEANGSLAVANSAYGKKFNEMWLKKCEQINNTGVVDTSEAKKTEGRHKAVAYLCNSSNWDSYVAKTTGENPTNVISGSYAVGGPTLELFVKAWNNRAANVTTTSINENNVTVDGYPETISFGISNDILKLSTGNKEGLFNPTGNNFEAIFLYFFEL